MAIEEPPVVGRAAEVNRLRQGVIMRNAKRRPSTRVPRGKQPARIALSPYLLEDVTFTLEEIRRARDAA